MKIGSFNFESNQSVFVIAEVGNNHNGSFERAIELIDNAASIGADCVKFQMRQLKNLYRTKSLNKEGEDLSAEYVLDLLNKFELTSEQHKKLFEYSKERGIQYLCTPWDEVSVDILCDFGVDGFKVASADFTNILLLEKIISTKKPFIVSTGMTTEEEIQYIVEYLKSKKAKFGILHCNSTYPAPLHDINLNYLDKLKKLHKIVGYSGHERGISVSLAATAKGARIIERHITLDRNMEGPDHAASLEPNEFKNLIDGIREISEALGSSSNRVMSQGEMINRENLGKSILASRPILKGTTLSRDDLMIRSPGQGLSPMHIDKLTGMKIQRDLKQEDFFYMTDITGNTVKPRKYNINMKWGVPVRYHDYNHYYSLGILKFIEFHLSYSDMNLEISDYLDDRYDLDFCVHAPELFEGSHLMDLASLDKEYLSQSIAETQRVINITQELSNYFPNTKRPLIIANIGGFSMDGVISESDKNTRYQIFEDSLGKLDFKNTELIPQTMAPFPWHFGGQRFQNLFVLPEEIAQYCSKLNLRICFDISHSMLTCNYFGISFLDYAKTVLPYTAHIHVGDAKGLNGEGLQIGEGDINFKEFFALLNDFSNDISFIPEIWQGHKNNGEGFWVAMEKLERIIC